MLGTEIGASVTAQVIAFRIGDCYLTAFAEVLEIEECVDALKRAVEEYLERIGDHAVNVAGDVLYAL